MPPRARGTGTDRPVQILLPPSETKRRPASGPALDLPALSRAALHDARQEMLEALVATSAAPDALARLGISAGQAELAARNTALAAEPTDSAGAVYTGVLYDALDLPTLPAAAASRAESCLVIFSALFGVLSPADRIPAYRLSAGSDVLGTGRPAAFWRPRLAAALEDRGGVVVDCRSGGYAAFHRVRDASRLVTVRVVEVRGGVEKVVSHWAKLTRGEVARLLLEADDVAGSPEDVADLVRDAGRTVRLEGSVLTVVTEQAAAA
jgi:uncharacterized protein